MKDRHNEDGPVPEGLHERVMDRLEAERLVRAATPPRGLARRWIGWRLAAVFLLGCATGFGIRRPGVVTIEKPVEVPVERIAERIVEQRVEVPVEKIVERVVERVVEKVVEKNVERPIETPLSPPLALVSSADGVERWAPLERRWRAVLASEEIRPGEVFRGVSAQSVVVYDGRKARIARSPYVLTPTLILDPIPDASQASLGRPEPIDLARSPSQSGSDRVPGLVRQWSTGSQEDRGQAQVELTRLWGELGDPGPSLLRRLSGDGGPAGVPEGPPITAEEWSEWWQRVRAQREHRLASSGG